VQVERENLGAAFVEVGALDSELLKESFVLGAEAVVEERRVDLVAGRALVLVVLVTVKGLDTGLTEKSLTSSAFYSPV